MVPVVTTGDIKYVDCPDFWVNTSSFQPPDGTSSRNTSGCYVTNTSHPSWKNIGECKEYSKDGVTYLNYCDTYPNAPTDTSNFDTAASDASFVGLDLDDIKGTSDCNKLKWAQLNGISWNGISNNYNLINGCSG
tara:strand:- start:1767 stop:2168 length:402 start_codon:yes stop_codon:yes gene_type:complete